MAITKTIQVTVKNRTDTATNWTSKNPVLAEGEIIVVQTSAGETRLKIGDGTKTFTQLPYTDENVLSKIKTYTAGNGISISDDGTISVTAAKIYTGTSNAPSADLGENGDIYIQTEG